MLQLYAWHLFKQLRTRNDIQTIYTLTVCLIQDESSSFTEKHIE
jgi:hypothetical protein